MSSAVGPPWRVIVADDDPSFRRLVRILLEDDPVFEVVGEAGNGAEAVEMAAALQPHTVILDMWMPVMAGHEALVLIKERCPDTDVIALSVDAWAGKRGPAPDAALEKGSASWMEVLPALVQILAHDRAAPAPVPDPAVSGA